MNRGIRLEADTEENEENFDFSNFNPDDMLTNKQNAGFNTKINLNTPPDEDFLYNNTLWPENSKLYGHGYEIISIAVSHDGSLIASGGKSQSEKHSKLFLWDATKNSLIKKFDGHQLTIVQIEFSYDDKYILTVSRDRSFCLFQRLEKEKDYKLIQLEKETHARIIWGCSWSNDSEIFLTGSRDNFLKVWLKNDNFSIENSEANEKPYNEALAYEFPDAITSVNLIDAKFNDNYFGFIGLENGEIHVISLKISNEGRKIILKQIQKFPEYLAHGLAVKRIKSFKDANNDTIKITTCSDDYSVRIFEMQASYLEKLLEVN